MRFWIVAVSLITGFGFRTMAANCWQNSHTPLDQIPRFLNLQAARSPGNFISALVLRDQGIFGKKVNKRSGIFAHLNYTQKVQSQIRTALNGGEKDSRKDPLTLKYQAWLESPEADKTTPALVSESHLSNETLVHRLFDLIKKDEWESLMDPARNRNLSHFRKQILALIAVDADFASWIRDCYWLVHSISRGAHIEPPGKVWAPLKTSDFSASQAILADTTFIFHQGLGIPTLGALVDLYLKASQSRAMKNPSLVPETSVRNYVLHHPGLPPAQMALLDLKIWSFYNRILPVARQVHLSELDIIALARKMALHPELGSILINNLSIYPGVLSNFSQPLPYSVRQSMGEIIQKTMNSVTTDADVNIYDLDDLAELNNTRKSFHNPSLSIWLGRWR